MSTDILNLPIAVQVALASGYAAYMLAFIGQRSHHKTVDVAFVTLMFSMIATAIWTNTAQHGLVSAGVASFLGTSVGGLVWRKWLSKVLQWLLRAANITWSNDDPSALATLSANTSYPVSQIGVQLDDGTWLECVETSRFNDAPYGPCILGMDGDVGLYLTHIEKPDGTRKEMETVHDSECGHRLTYVPASRIRRITLRHLPKISHP